MPPWVYTMIAVCVTVTWVLANVVGWAQGTPPDTQIHLVMGAVVGMATGMQALSKRDRKKRQEKRDNDGIARGDSRA